MSLETIKIKATFIFGHDTKILEHEENSWDELDSRPVMINNRWKGLSQQWTSRTVFGETIKTKVLKEDPQMQGADDWSSVSLNQCRCCKGENTNHYENIYFEVCDGFDKLYCFENGYCEKCAISKTEIVHQKSVPCWNVDVLEERVDHTLDGCPIVVQRLRDGTTRSYEQPKLDKRPVVEASR